MNAADARAAAMDVVFFATGAKLHAELGDYGEALEQLDFLAPAAARLREQVAELARRADEAAP